MSSTSQYLQNMNKFLYLPIGVFILLLNWMCYMGLSRPFSVSGEFTYLLAITALCDIGYTYKIGKITGEYLKPWYYGKEK